MPESLFAPLAVLASLLAALPALRRGSGKRLRLVAAAYLALTAAWAAAMGAATLGPEIVQGLPAWTVDLLDILRTAVGIGSLLLLLSWLLRVEEAAGKPAVLLAILGVLTVTALADLALAAAYPALGGMPGAAPMDLGLVARLGLDVLMLLVVENLFRHGRDATRWATKHLLIGFGAVAAFDLYVFADALLYQTQARPLMGFRPAVTAMVAPLLAVSLHRMRTLDMEVAVSRSVVLHTTTLIGAGLYLLAVAAVGYGVGRVDAAWAEVAHFVLMFGAALMLAVLLLSAEAKDRLRHLVSRHFFPLTYDYRREWLRFIDTMARDSADTSLYRRAVRAVADVFDCSGGAIFLHQRADVYVQVARHEWSSAGALLALPAPVIERLAATKVPLDLRSLTTPDRAAATDADAPLRAALGCLDRPWAAVPLLWRDTLIGVILLGQPRAPRPLGWEERDLLQVLGVQVASYLREDQASRALAVAQRFERTGRRFTFVAHDVKNLVSQLGLVVQQAERHGRNPEFVADALETVRHAVDRMRGLLVRLRDTPDAPGPAMPLDLASFIGEIVERKRAAFPRLSWSVEQEVPFVQADPLAVTTVVENLIQNAAEAGDGQTSVHLSLRAEGDGAVLDIADNGPGMARSFVETVLFAPFASTKESGFGIGMYQCRCLAEEWGGDISVDSAPGAGTRVRVRFPGMSLPVATLKQ